MVAMTAMLMAIATLPTAPSYELCLQAVTGRVRLPLPSPLPIQPLSLLP